LNRVTTFLLPGLSNSGPEHWQSYWERTDSTCRRIEQAEWETPHCADWVAELDAAIASTAEDVVLVAHSSSCAMVAHWSRDASAETRARVRGALLVAPSDPEGPNYPSGPTGFAPVPLVPLPFPSIVVASTNDEYVSPAQARAYAAAWESTYVEIGAAGHINSASGLGAWPAGRALLERLRFSLHHGASGAATSFPPRRGFPS
jgi:predicted alpha/beta hydrolase family esterase